MRAKKTVFTWSFVLISTFLFGGGPWTPKKGKGYGKLGQSIISASRFFSKSGDIVDINSTSVYQTYVYGEYGITDRFAVELYFPFLYRQTLTRIVGTSGRVINPGDEYTGIADANVELKYNLLSSGNFVVSAGLLFGLPIGTTNGGDTQLMQSGDGEFNQRLMAYAGYSVPNTNLYFAGGAGVNNRTKDFSDSFHGQLEAGYVLGNVSFHLKSYIVQSFFNGEAATSANGIFSNNLEYISYGPEVNVNITDQLGVGASVFFASQGRSVLAAPSIGGGVFYTW